jgi:hypothetical protein
MAQGIDEFVHDGILSRAHAVDEAVLHVVLKHYQRGFSQGGARGRSLGEHVVAVGVLGYHAP